MLLTLIGFYHDKITLLLYQLLRQSNQDKLLKLIDFLIASTVIFDIPNFPSFISFKLNSSSNAFNILKYTSHDISPISNSCIINSSFYSNSAFNLLILFLAAFMKFISSTILFFANKIVKCSINSFDSSISSNISSLSITCCYLIVSSFAISSITDLKFNNSSLNSLAVMCLNFADFTFLSFADRFEIFFISGEKKVNFFL